MKYYSTRDKSKKYTAAQAILAGLAPDGGLLLPEELPHFCMDEIVSMKSQKYPELAAFVMSKFMEDYSREELLLYARDAYSGFESADTAPLARLNENTDVLELFHGPTCAFKDFALQMLPRLMTAAMEKCSNKNTVAILVATSGDTGKAALEGFKNVENTKLCVFYPHGGTSEIQRLQMASQQGSNVNVFAVRGNFDDTQTAVKEIFTDKTAIARLKSGNIELSSANSINWGRLVPQIAYYFSAYVELLRQNRIKAGDKISFVVPTGNFGNILAGYFAKKSGLPIDKLVCASNENNVLTDFMRTGVYNKNRPFHLTASPSMDILISSNLERLLFMLCGRDDSAVCTLMTALKAQGSYDIGQELLCKMADEGFIGYCADDRAGAETIEDIWNKYHYLCDTHTAVAINACLQYRNDRYDTGEVVVLSTASPFKFAPAMLSALSLPSAGDEFQKLATLERFSGLPAPLALSGLKDCATRFNTVLDIDGMKENTINWLVKR